MSIDQGNLLDKAIKDDYQGFIEKLKQKNPVLYVTEVNFYEDVGGQHAVKLIIEVAPREYQEFYFMYNKSNVRTKVVKGSSWHQFHM